MCWCWVYLLCSLFKVSCTHFFFFFAYTCRYALCTHSVSILSFGKCNISTTRAPHPLVVTKPSYHHDLITMNASRLLCYHKSSSHHHVLDLELITMCSNIAVGKGWSPTLISTCCDAWTCKIEIELQEDEAQEIVLFELIKFNLYLQDKDTRVLLWKIMQKIYKRELFV